MIFFLKSRGSSFLGLKITLSDEKVGLIDGFDTVEMLTIEFYLIVAKALLDYKTNLCYSWHRISFLATSLKFIPIAISYIFCYNVAKVSKLLYKMDSSVVLCVSSVLFKTVSINDFTIYLNLTLVVIVNPKIFLWKVSFHQILTLPFPSIPIIDSWIRKGNLTLCSSSLKPLHAWNKIIKAY